jgi:hypothetical protein
MLKKNLSFGTILEIKYGQNFKLEISLIIAHVHLCAFIYNNTACFVVRNKKQGVDENEAI